MNVMLVVGPVSIEPCSLSDMLKMSINTVCYGFCLASSMDYFCAGTMNL